MKILKKYRSWKRFKNLLEHWEERLDKLEDINVNYKPRKRLEFFKYGRVVGEMDSIKQALRILKYDS